MVDEKVNQLTELTVITGNDLVYLVDDPIDYTPEEFSASEWKLYPVKENKIPIPKTLSEVI